MDLDPVLLARLQFAFTITFHIIFPAFTIGLSAYIATLVVMWLRTGKEHYRLLARFWTKIFAVSFAMGVVSGIVLSYQFGTNWSRFSAVVGNVVGPLIGYEVLTAFFLEATFLGVMLFGWNRVPPWLHMLSAIVVAVGTLLSAFWILSANSWMQTPAGHEMRDGIAYPRRLARDRLQSELPLPPRAHGDGGLPHHVVRRAGGGRALPARRPASASRPHHAAHGGRLRRHRGAAAALDRRPARPQHARAPADEDRRHRGALGRQQARRSRAVRLAGRGGRDATASRSRSRTAGSLHPHPRAGTACSPASRACRRRTGRRSCRRSSPSASWSASACS